jgi:hypothetical protein
MHNVEKNTPIPSYNNSFNCLLFTEIKGRKSKKSGMVEMINKMFL